MKFIFNKNIRRITKQQNILACMVVLFCFAGNAQEDSTKAKKKFAFGLSVGMKYAQIIAEKNSDFAQTINDEYSIDPTSAVGISGGVSVIAEINDKFGISFSLLADIIDTDLTLTLPTGSPVRREVFGMTTNLPLLLEYKIMEAKYSPIAKAGFAFVYDIPQISIESIQLQPFDYQFVVGFGVLKENEKYNIGLDIMYGLGLSNILLENDDIHTEAIGSIKRNTIGLIFHIY